MTTLGSTAVEPLDFLAARDLCTVLRVFHLALDDNASWLDSINVVPVADGDTGANMRRTVAVVVAALPDPGVGLIRVQRAVADAAVLAGPRPSSR